MAKIKKRIVLKNCNYKAQLHCFNNDYIIYPKLIGANYKIWYSRGFSSYLGFIRKNI